MRTWGRCAHHLFGCKGCYEDELAFAGDLIGWPEGYYCPNCIASMAQGFQKTCSQCGTIFMLKWHSSYPHVCQDCRKSQPEKEATKVSQINKRAIKLGLTANLTLDEWIATLDHWAWLCAYCQKRPYAVVDHFISLDKASGPTTKANCVPCCYRCNSLKGSYPQGRCGMAMEVLEPVRNYLASLEEAISSVRN